ncbi:MAG: hypothetical protein LBQ35_07805 [Spirochaetaceae bacterium]|jgi:hypothetical protein|nr:hypothetical protein [Spirochaetaceae bacterium]
MPEKRNLYLTKPLRAGLSLSLVLLPALLAAQPVDREELQAGSAPIEFINYEGPHARIETLEQIRGIGASLGTVIASGVPQAGSGERYFVIHSVTGPEGNKLNADIFVLGVDAGVDHIRNLRLIIQGYLEAAYAYPARDAALLAEFITIYNAVFRGNWDYLNGRYKTAVMGHLVRERAGLSIRFDEWPGQAMLLIPLATAAAGSLSAVDTTSLTAPEVVADMRSQEDRGVETRREMVELKEREAAEAERQAAEQREAAEQARAQVDRGREEAAREREQIAREREQIAREREQAATPEAPAGNVPAEQARREEELAAREEALAEQEAQLDRAEEEAAAQRGEAEETQAFAERKEEEARQERQEIARDQQVIIAEQDRAEPAPPAGILGVALRGAESSLGRVVRLNAATGSQIRAGGMSTVNARSLIQAGGKLIAIAGENQGGAAIRLVEINPETLEMAAQGDVDIHPQSLLWQSGDNLYAITLVNGRPYLARFNTNLARVAQSAITVHPLGAPSVSGDALVIQREDGSVALLNVADLSERR